MSAILSFDDVSVSYGNSPILRGISLDVSEGETLGIIGESGSGKSTLLYTVLGILGRGGRVENGSVRYRGTELLTLKREEMRALRGKEISLIAQDPAGSFSPVRKVREQLYELTDAHGRIPHKEAEARFKGILERIDLKEGDRILDSYAFEMSGGMCQRVSIAMAMVLNPNLLLADEPTSALDVITQKQVAREMLRLREEYHNTIIVVSHNMGVISYMSDAIAVMYDGRLWEYGKKDRIIQNPFHFYTKALIAAVPSTRKPLPKGIRLSDTDRRGEGCPFWRVCEKSAQICGEKLPEMKSLAPDHQVRCHLAEGGC